MNLNDFLDKIVSESAAELLKAQGKSKHKSDSDYCPIELEIGMKVEKEHLDSEEARKEIAKDHLEENPHYYTTVLAPKEKDVMEIAMKVLRKNGYRSIKDFLAKSKKMMKDEE
jgi:hypothetical protein